MWRTTVIKIKPGLAKLIDDDFYLFSNAGKK